MCVSYWCCRQLDNKMETQLNSKPPMITVPLNQPLIYYLQPIINDNTIKAHFKAFLLFKQVPLGRAFSHSNLSKTAKKSHSCRKFSLCLVVAFINQSHTSVKRMLHRFLLLYNRSLQKFKIIFFGGAVLRWTDNAVKTVLKRSSCHPGEQSSRPI